jgi:molybdopterin biosynthesis enzyme MoaB
MNSKEEQALRLVTELRLTLDVAQHRILNNIVVPDQIDSLISKLTEMLGSRSDVMSLTGPSGYNPQPTIELCSVCGHQRFV